MSTRPLAEKIGLTEEAWRARLAFLGIGTEDERRLGELLAQVGGDIDGLLERFYQHLLAFPETRRLLEQPGRVARLKELQRAYFRRLLEGDYGSEYCEGRLRVGDAHQRVDLPPAVYVSSYAIYLRLVIEAVMKRWGEEPARAAGYVDALIKVMFLDIGLATDAYLAGGYVERSLAREYQAAAERAERALQSKHEAEQTRNDLTSMIVHDLKSPISAIHSLAQLALRSPTDEPQARAFHQILQRCSDLLRMIQNLVETSKMEEGKLEVARASFDLGGLLRECGAELAVVAEQSQQQIEVRVDPGTPAVLADRELTKRVVVNLVVNSIRHSHATGVIEISARGAGIDQVQLAVADHGQGIAPEDHEVIFEKFHTGSRAVTRMDTGLGLPFCRLAVARMGGRIWVESALGEGSCFCVTLPAASG